jgi:hypothetical protein
LMVKAESLYVLRTLQRRIGKIRMAMPEKPPRQYR